MAITFAAERQQLSESVVTADHAFAPSATIAAGKLALIGYGCAGAPTFDTCVDSKSNTWTIEIAVNNGSNLGVVIAWSVLTSALLTSDTVTLHEAASTHAGSGVLWEVDNPHATPGDESLSGSGAISAMSVGPTGTLAQADEFAFALFGWTAAAKTYTAGAGWSQPSAGEVIPGAGANIRQVAPEYQELASTSAITAEGQYSGGNVAWAGVVVTFMGAAAVVPPKPIGNRLRRWLTQEGG